MTNNYEFAKTQPIDIEERDPFKELAKAICKRYIIDVLQEPPKCNEKMCLDINGKLKSKCMNCFEKTFQKDKRLINYEWTELLFEYAEMERVYELLKEVFSKYNTLEEFRIKTNKGKEFWDYIDFVKGHSVEETLCNRRERVKKKIFYILLDKDKKEIGRESNLSKFKKLLCKKLKKVYPLKVVDKMLDDYLLNTNTANVPYSIKVEVVKK